jgi:hypothetical protein
MSQVSPKVVFDPALMLGWSVKIHEIQDLHIPLHSLDSLETIKLYAPKAEAALSEGYKKSKQGWRVSCSTTFGKKRTMRSSRVTQECRRPRKFSGGMDLPDSRVKAQKGNLAGRNKERERCARWQRGLASADDRIAASKPIIKAKATPDESQGRSMAKR